MRLASAILLLIAPKLSIRPAVAAVVEVFTGDGVAFTGAGPDEAADAGASRELPPTMIGVDEGRGNGVEAGLMGGIVSVTTTTRERFLAVWPGVDWAFAPTAKADKNSRASEGVDLIFINTGELDQGELD
jgi:hypothetical protein